MRALLFLLLLAGCAAEEPRPEGPCENRGECRWIGEVYVCCGPSDMAACIPSPCPDPVWQVMPEPEMSALPHQPVGGPALVFDDSDVPETEVLLDDCLCKHYRDGHPLMIAPDEDWMFRPVEARVRVEPVTEGAVILDKKHIFFEEDGRRYVIMWAPKKPIATPYRLPTPPRLPVLPSED